MHRSENQFPGGFLFINELTEFPHRPPEVGGIGNSTLELGKMKYREVRLPAQSHTAPKGGDSNPSVGERV